MINAAYISIKLRHLAHLETREKSSLRIDDMLRAISVARPISPFSVDDHE